MTSEEKKGKDIMGADLLCMQTDIKQKPQNGAESSTDVHINPLKQVSTQHILLSHTKSLKLIYG